MLETFFDTINAPEVTFLSSAFKLLLSMLLGSVIGYERKQKGQIAGVRTFSLICMGATLAMILSIYVPQVYLGLKNGDPSRIAAQVVSGIGFLGAGAIIQMKGSVRGLTTAAGIWMVATLGLAIGVGMYAIACLATLLILFILLQLEKIEHKVTLGNEARIIRVEISEIIDDIAPYRKVLKEKNVILTNYYLAFDYETCTTRLNLMILANESISFVKLFDALRQVYPTRNISMANQVSF
ncbi:MAG: MgtC/SapB family protein [Clostridium sp.]|nr:MgtC/SapB family protein [Clostridium sp.]